MRRQLGQAEATPGQQRASEGTSGYEEGSRPQGTGWENEQVWRGSDGKKESPPSRISRTASPYPPLSHPAPTSPHLPSTRQPGRPPPASLARAEHARCRSLVMLGSGSMAPLGLSERACSRVPVAFGGFLGLPPCKRHAEATALGLRLLALPVDQHCHTAGLYQKMTAPSLLSGQHGCPEVPCWKTTAPTIATTAALRVVACWVPSSPPHPKATTEAAAQPCHTRPGLLRPGATTQPSPGGSSRSRRGAWRAMKASGGGLSGPVLEEIFRVGERLSL